MSHSNSHNETPRGRFADDHRVGAEKAVLVAVDTAGRKAWGLEERMEELAELARTAGAEVVDTVTQRRQSPHPATYIGAGKVKELAALCGALGADLAIFHEELSPAQIRNLEQQLDIRVIDRTQLILDIFAQRAHTREGKLQVELAQLNYTLPRLTGKGIALSRLGAGIGTRGPGETKLETDRRRIRDRIKELEGDLKTVAKQRDTMRRRRQAAKVPVAALVGYTNAGKSTLLRRLTGTETLVADKLFATLDPLVRRTQLGEDGPPVLLADTVGFIQDLPHHLVAAFRATLEEVVQADILIHVVDASHPMAPAMIDAVNEVLTRLGAGDKPMVTVFNKIDLVEAGGLRLPEGLLASVPMPVAVSSLTGQGLDDLVDAIQQLLRRGRHHVAVHIPYDRMELLSLMHDHGHVSSVRYDDEGARVEAEVDEALARRLEPLAVPAAKD